MIHVEEFSEFHFLLFEWEYSVSFSLEVSAVEPELQESIASHISVHCMKLILRPSRLYAFEILDIIGLQLHIDEAPSTFPVKTLTHASLLSLYHLLKSYLGDIFDIVHLLYTDPPPSHLMSHCGSSTRTKMIIENNISWFCGNLNDFFHYTFCLWVRKNTFTIK